MRLIPTGQHVAARGAKGVQRGNRFHAARLAHRQQRVHPVAARQQQRAGHQGVAAIVAAPGHRQDRGVFVVAGGNPFGNRQPGARHQVYAVFARRALDGANAVQIKQGHHVRGSPQRAISVCGMRSWSRMRATTKSTMSSTVPGWV